ncbi:MAG TPA: lipopolysaccharide heptosyltransferase family protein [Aquificales bacterium]|nr:lipopolysaccharide heptosyltransferase family protein [Aquificales bacterium]
MGFGVQRGLRTSLSLYLAGVKERVGFQNAELSFLYTKRVAHKWGIHEVERNQNLLKAVGIKPHTDSLFLPVSEEDLQKVRDKFRLPERYVAVSPSANFLPKRWAEGHFAKLIDLLLEEGFKVVLTGGKEDTEVSHRVLSLIKDPKGVLDLSGKTSVGELVAVIKLAKVLVSNDSAPVHIAEAVGTPAVSVYCATSSHYGFYPRSGLYFEPRGLTCHPCKPNPKVCKTGTLECRYAVKPEEVFKGVLNLLEG